MASIGNALGANGVLSITLVRREGEEEEVKKRKSPRPNERYSYVLAYSPVGRKKRFFGTFPSKIVRVPGEKARESMNIIDFH